MVTFQKKERKESFVFEGEIAQRLSYLPLNVELVVVTNLEGDISYVNGRDYIIEQGWIKRIQDGRIPDFRNHIFYGKYSFDHREVVEYSNRDFTCIVSYQYNGADNLEEIKVYPINKELPKVADKLNNQQKIKFVVYGDSISTGMEASSAENTYFERFANVIKLIYPNSEMEIMVKALGGESSRGGVQRIRKDVITHQPDLVSIAYGMNDQNRAGNDNAISLLEFKDNLEKMIKIIQEGTNAEIMLLTPCLPNVKWVFASNNVFRYADVIRILGAEQNVPVIDVQKSWIEYLVSGKSHESLLLNNLNHPNDFGHFIYFEALKKTLFY